MFAPFPCGAQVYYDGVMANMKRCAQLLLAAGGDPALANHQGRTALDCHADRSEDASVFPGTEAQFELARARARAEIQLLHDGTEEGFATALRARGLAHTTHSRGFDSGNVVAWEELAPAEGEPEGLLVFHNGMYCSSLILRDFGLDFCERTRFRVVLLDLPGVGRCLVREGGISHLRDAAAQAAPTQKGRGGSLRTAGKLRRV